MVWRKSLKRRLKGWDFFNTRLLNRTSLGIVFFLFFSCAVISCDLSVINQNAFSSDTIARLILYYFVFFFFYYLSTRSSARYDTGTHFSRDCARTRSFYNQLSRRVLFSPYAAAAADECDRKISIVFCADVRVFFCLAFSFRLFTKRKTVKPPIGLLLYFIIPFAITVIYVSVIIGNYKRRRLLTAAV